MTRTERLNNAIEKKRNILIAKANKKGLYENFGQKERRELEDEFGYVKEVADFEEWCENYEIGKTYKGVKS